MKPSTIISLVSAAIFAIGTAVFCVYAFFVHKDADVGVKWHFWLAPILTLGIAATLVQVMGMYWLQVGRKETSVRQPVE